MKRIFRWCELGAELQLAAVAKLTRLAEAKARYDGTLLPYAWPERVAPLCKYVLTPRGRSGQREIWDVRGRNAGESIFQLTPLSL